MTGDGRPTSASTQLTDNASDPAAILGTYVLPGRGGATRDGLDQARVAEEIGFGSVWLSESWDTKELGALAGAVSQVTERTRIVTATTHFGTRHPLVLAGLGTTLNALSQGRFVLGFGRGGAAAGPVLREFGGRADTIAAMRDHAAILRRIWAGERFSYSGPAGEFAHLGSRNTPPGLAPPLLLAAIGEKTLALAGECFDGVILAPFVSPEGVRRSTEIVRNAAADAGRDPAAVRIYGIVVVAPDLPPEEQAAIVGGRAVGYFQEPRVARRIANINGWDAKVFEPLWHHPKFSGPGTASSEFRADELVEVSRLIDDEYLMAGSSIGTASECADGLRPFLEAGADELVLHGTSADKCRALVAAFRESHVRKSTVGQTDASGAAR
ncbi:TIGR03857 family LLM class F420-dependent oxidoreductase [Streptomyces blattellae]|uniref:TIGR03857 family LLM class F420-dependent oxidoreductase n=1 Tax=Streptomyces blattellae TaxID=2569855 RepID=UPI0012B6DD72|nr:TIGR03857 family LLM class F420-dependent oxidoreductase [Streptomyces blattellae]